MPSEITKLTLPGGLRILLEPVPGVRSASMGIWVQNGSRYESARENGASHFIEHMLFKGTENRTAAQIAAELDRLGGNSNAFTTKESTAFYIRTLDTEMERAADLLADMFFHSRFSEQDTALEKTVIYEEIDMYEDTPDDLVMEKLAQSVYGDAALGRPILGTRESLEPMTGADLRAFQQSHYTPENTVIAVSGSFPERFPAYLEALFSDMPRRPAPKMEPAVYRPVLVTTKKRIEQNHLCLGFAGYPVNDPDRYAMGIVSNLFGGGMSSRLFQRVREQAGLCYAIASYTNPHADVGCNSIYVGLSHRSQAKALAMIRQEIDRLLQDGPTQEELDLAREQAKISTLMGLESTMNRMTGLATSELRQGRQMPVEELIDILDALTLDDLRRVAPKMYNISTFSFSAVGNVAALEQYRSWFGL